MQKINNPEKKYLDKLNYYCLWKASTWISESVQSTYEIHKRNLRCCMLIRLKAEENIIAWLWWKMQNISLYLFYSNNNNNRCKLCCISSVRCRRTCIPHHYPVLFSLTKVYAPRKYCFNIKKCGMWARSIQFWLLLEKS